LLKSDLHAGRRQKRNSNRDLRSVNPSTMLEVAVSGPGSAVLRAASPSKAAQFNDRTQRVNTQRGIFFRTLFPSVKTHHHDFAPPRSLPNQVANERSVGRRGEKGVGRNNQHMHCSVGMTTMQFALET